VQTWVTVYAPCEIAGIFILFYILAASQARLPLEPLHQPFSCGVFVCLFVCFFEIGSGEIFAKGWLQTEILLISASCQCLALIVF
jgi:hypothetical protein